MRADNKTLFDQLGGEKAIEAAVASFYKKVLIDKRIAHFFEGIDKDKLHAHQKAFMTYAFGGAAHYSGRSLREAHAKLVEKMGLNDSHFDAVEEHLRTTLKEMNIPGDLISEVMAIVEGTRDNVLNR